MSLRAALIFLSCSLLLLMSLFYRASSAIIAPILISDLGLTPNDLGLLGGCFFYSFAVIQLPLGLFIDKIGPKVTMIVLNSIAVVGAVVFATSKSPTLAIVGRSLLGFGVASNLMGPLKIFTRWFEPRKFATMSGSLLSLASLGSLAACSPLAVLVDFLGWRGSFYALAGVHFLLIVFMIFVVRDQRGDRPDSKNDHKGIRPGWLHSYTALFSSWSYWAISFSVFLRYGAFACIQSLWAGPFLIGLLGLSPITAGNILLLMNLGFIVGAPIGGSLSDRILRSRKKAIFLAYSISAGASFTLAYYQGSSSLIVLGFIFFVIGFFNAFNQISFAHIKELMPEEISGSAMTGINFFLMMGAGVFTHGLGIILDKVSGPTTTAAYYSQAFLICFVAFALSSIFYLTVRDPNMSLTKG
ncbi:MAG: MFS transporter [Syntrophorhabdus sp.]